MYLFSVYECFVCVSVCTTHAYLVSLEAGRWLQFHGDWHGLLRIKPSLLERVASALNHCTMSLARC